MGIRSEILIHTPKEEKHLTGEHIRGIVKFHLDKETVFKKISLSLTEKGYCSWYDESEFDLVDRYKSQNLLEGNENVLVMKIYFLNKDVDDNVTLSAGSYEYPFEMEIPENIPPSFKSDTGKIKYYILLKFKKSGIMNRNKTFRTEVTIYPRVSSSIADEPISFKLDKSLTKMFSSNNGEINIIGELEKQYLTFNKERNISFAVTNNSDVNFTIKTELIWKTKYKHDYSFNLSNFDEKTKKEVIDYCTFQTPIVPDNSVSNMCNVIPPVDSQEYTVRHSDIISREYKLRVTLQLPLPHFNTSVEIPVFIGEGLHERDEDKVDEPLEEPPSYWEAMSEHK